MKVFDINQKFQGVVITGVGRSLPPLSFTNDDLVAWHGHKDPDFIYERIGVKSRHSLFDYRNNKPTDMDEDDLAAEASQRALDDCGMDVKDIDAIFFTSTSPSHNIFPDPACILHGRLKASIDTPAITLTAGCTGTLNGLMLAISMIQAGQARHVMVTAASAFTSYFRPHLKDKVWLHSCIFGDGAAALIISKREGASKRKEGFGRFFLGSDYTRDVAVKAMGGSRVPIDEGNAEEFLNDYPVFDFRKVPDNIVLKLDYVYKNLMSMSDISPSKIDWILINQANAVKQRQWIIDTGFKPEKAFSNFETQGNCAAASLALTMHDFIKEAQPKKGEMALIMALGTGLQYGGTLYQF